MSVEQIETTLLQLPCEERRRFADWFYRHESEIVGEPAEEDRGDDLSPAQSAELLRRSAELAAHPGLAVPVTDEWFDGLKHRLAHAHAPQTPTR